MVGLADMSSVSRENIEVMDALIGNFTLYDDVNKVYDILKGHRKLSLLCEEKRAGAKESVKQLQKQVETLQSEKDDLTAQNEKEMRQENDKLKKQVRTRVRWKWKRGAEDSWTGREQQLTADANFSASFSSYFFKLARVESEASGLEANIKELNLERDRLRTSLDEMEEKNDHRKKHLSEHEHRVKHELSLFAHISKINWTATEEGGKGEIRGVISKTNKGGLNTFCFDTKKVSKYHIANKLWDAMDE